MTRATRVGQVDKPINTLQITYFLHCSRLQVKCPTKLNFSEEKQFQWDILFERQEVCKPEVGHFTLPVWAGTWKIMNFAFRQQKQKWDRIWPDYEQDLSNKIDKVQQLEEQVGTKMVFIFGFLFFHSFIFVSHIETK